MEYTIIHNEAAQSFETEVEGHKASVEYYLRDNTINILHTWVPKPIEGRSIAAALTKFALDYAKQNQLKVIPNCSYTQVYIKRHEEYRDLLF
ncbi:MAG: N-acetyltransferase [Prevotellaceae bacterium]|jgi:predicted GNAT family acetyltransferase|nr:N-acetyltransferase [Prevotellaceae bacterium]